MQRRMFDRYILGVKFATLNTILCLIFSFSFIPHDAWRLSLSISEQLWALQCLLKKEIMQPSMLFSGGHIFRGKNVYGIFSVQNFRKIWNAMAENNIVELEVIWIIRKSHVEHRIIIWLEMWCKTTVLVNGLKWFCNSSSLRITNAYSGKMHQITKYTYINLQTLLNVYFNHSFAMYPFSTP